MVTRAVAGDHSPSQARAGSVVVVQPAPVTATAAGLPALSAPRLDSVPKPALLPSLL